MIFDRNASKPVIALLGEHATFITGTDLLIDGGVIACIRTGGDTLH